MSRVIPRLIPFIAIACLIVILISAIAGIDPTADPTASSSATEPPATATPTAVVNPATPTATQTSSPQISALKTGLEFVFGILTRMDNMIQALWPLLVGLLISSLVVLLIVRALEESQAYRLEFDKLQNGTGDATLDDALPGLEALVREKLISRVKHLKHNIDQYASEVAAGAEFPSGTLTPQEVGSKETLDKVIEALGEESPKYAKPFLSLWRYLFPSRGLRVRMTLQGDGDSTRPLAITFEFLDLQTQENSIARTIREERQVKPAIYPWLLCQGPISDKRKEHKVELPPRPLAQAGASSWLLEVAEALVRASLYQDAIIYFEKALVENKTDGRTIRGLVSCQNKLAQRAGRALTFAAASRLEESHHFDTAIESYASIFPDQKDVEMARQQWQFALGIREGSKGEALHQLAEKYRQKADLYDEAVRLYQRAVEEGHLASIQILNVIQTEQADALVDASRWLFENAQWVAAEAYLTKALTAVPDHKGALQLQRQLQASKPVQEDKEALAAFEVGKIYLARGRQTTATDYFVKALEKQPNYQDAQKALTNVLIQSRSLRTRFEALLDTSLVWLAVELFRQQTDRKVTSTGAFQIMKARYHTFYGAHLLSYYERQPSFFAQRAEEDFLEAIRACKTWWQPYKQLGNLYYLLGLNQPEAETAYRKFKKASAWFGLALEQLDFRPDGRPTALADPALRLRIQVDRLVSDLMSCPPADELSRLWHELEAIESQIRRGKQTSRHILLFNEFELVYFGLAVWYAVVDYRYRMTRNASDSSDPEQAGNRARFYLTCAVFCDPIRMREAELNAILTRLFADKARADIVHEIEIKRVQGQYPSPTYTVFWEDVYELLRKVLGKFSDILEKEA